MYYYNLAQYFNDVACANHERDALRYKDFSVSYAQMNEWIESLATLLLEKGCCRGDVISIGHSKRPLSYALMHAALRLGAAYVIIDVASPIERTAKVIEASGATFLFYDAPENDVEMEKLAARCGCSLLFLSPDLLALHSESAQDHQKNIMQQVDGSTIAYIMFTSGSTGMPKGVAVTHQNVLHFIAWGQKYFNVTSRDNFANLSPMYFDNSVFDFYVGMFSGASLTPIDQVLLTSPYELVPYVEKMNCTIWFSVPSLLMYLMTMKAISATSMPALRAIVFGGEGFPKVELKKLYNIFTSQANLVNVYGPTECTCICSAHTLDDDDFIDLSGLPTLGRLNSNFDYRILDEQGNDSDSGELCLIGANVAAGYFNDLKRTASAFHTLTEPDRFMKRMYRTGDLVRESEGKLYFLGRKDNQIKHMGYRIELEEIEHALVKLAPVNQAAAIYHRTNAAYGKIIGFVACSNPAEEKSLLADLADLLPSYMVPSRIIIVVKLPKNANGKVDRQQLRVLYDS